MKSIKITILSILFVSAIALSSSAQCTEKPVISAQPVNTITCNGSSASFSVGQSGGTSYQWYWRGSSGSGIVPKTYPWSGYNSNTLTIAYNSASTAGTYWVVITNACGSTISSEVSLTVNPASSIALSSNGPICEGSVLELSSPGGMLNYSWTGPNGFSSTLQNPSITNLTTAAAGTYNLTVTTSNQCSVSQSITVNVSSTVIPSVSISAVNSNWCEDGEAIFTTTINNGGSSPLYQWLINGNPVEGATSSTFTSSLLSNEKVSCRLTSNATCVTTAVAMSNTITVTRCFDNSMNYVTSRNILIDNVHNENNIDQMPPEEVQEVTTYFDGIGRPVQKVNWQSSSSYRDLVQPIVYDAFGRETVKYLPYVSGNSGHFKANAVSESGSYIGSPQYEFYTGSDNSIINDNAPYQKVIFENSPLNRTLKQGAVGETWQPNGDNSYVAADKTIKNAYEFNKAGEVLVWTYTAPTTELPIGIVNAGSSTSPLYYEANQLYKNRTKDENGNEFIEYKDKEGLVILRRVQVVKGASAINDVNYASTYYIYDDLSSLVCVIPPEAVRQITASGSTAYFDQTDVVKDAFLKRWAFRYVYDSRKRMTQKQVPGADAVYMVYDGRNRLVLTQDGNQRVNKQWLFTKYDELNRPIATGIKDTAVEVSQVDMQKAVNNHYAKSWTRYGETYIGNTAGNIHGYSNKSYPVFTTGTIADVNRYLTITYYDNYTFKSHDSYTIKAYFGTNYNYINDALTETVNGYLYEQPSNEFASVIGQVTGTKVKVLDGGVTGSAAGGYTWLKSVNYYDDKYRVIQIVSDNYKSGTDRLSNLYDFVGKALKTKALHIESDVQWTDLVLTTVVGNYLRRTDPSSAWTAGAASVQSLPAGQDGWVEFVASEENTGRMVGLSAQNNGVHYNTIGYAIHPRTDKTVGVYENGALKKELGTYAIGDIFRIARVGTAVKYYKNGLELHPSAVTSSGPLLVDVSLNTTAGTVVGVKSSFSTSNHTILRRYVYDHAGRLLNTYYTLDSGPEVLLASNEYNELGQLIDKGLHSVNGSTPMQSVDYRYNIRGWLTSMNNSELSSDGETNDDTGDFFGMNLGYNEELGTSNTESMLSNAGLVGSYTLNGNASDAVADGLNGVVYGAQLTADSQGNSASAYNFTANDYIDIPNSKDKHSFIQNTGKFTISAFVKINDLSARSVIVSSTATSTAKGFCFMYETYGSGYGDHQLRFMTTNGSTSFSAVGSIRTINDNNWHHVAVVGDGNTVRFYVDGVSDASPTAITLFSTGSATSTTLIGKTRSASGLFLGMSGAIDEVNIFNEPLDQSEIKELSNRTAFNAILDKGQYNGNISGMKWSVNQGLGDTKEMAYNFEYDALNRLVSANNLQSSLPGAWEVGKYHERNLTYDLNGNITSLSRSSEPGVIDNLVYNYGTGTTQSNKLLSVTDKTTDAIIKLKGFTDSNTTGNDYTYDVNGNMTVDLNKGLSSPIIYNYLNLPEVVTRGGNTVRYIYDAAGRKLSQVVRAGFGIKQTDYAREFIYEDDMLRFINHEEGRIVMSSEKLLYKHDGETLEGMTALNSTLSVVTVNGEKYVNATSSGTGSGILPIGNAINVVPGERYLIRIKGYRSTYNAGVMIRRNNSTISYGSYLPTPVSNEAWMEQIYVVPPNTNVLEIGVGWSVPTGSAGLNINAFELIKLESAAPEYQYNLKDHLGNVRLTFTTKVEEDIYTATFEDSTQTDETKTFKNYSRVTSDLFDHTDAGTAYTKAQMLNGSSGSQVGLAKTLSVMPGDVIKAEVYAKYLGAEGGSTDLSTFGAALLSAFNLSAPLAGETGTARAALQDYGTFIAGNGNPGNEDSPKGWLNILVFDRDHNLVDLAFEQLSSAYVQEVGSVTKAAHQLLSKEVTIKEPGYVYIYVSNEGSIAQEVYFDDFMISHKKSAVIETNDYYPFGLTFNSHRRENNLLNKYQYNGKELQNALDLNWLDYGARMYMNDLGRWGVLDPLGEKGRRWSPYNYALNNPIRFIDPDGMWPGEGIWNGMKKIGTGFVQLASKFSSESTYKEIGKGAQEYKTKAKEITDKVEVKVSTGYVAGVKVGKVGVEVNFGSKEVLNASTSTGVKVNPDNAVTKGFSISYGAGEAELQTKTTTTQSTTQVEVVPGITMNAATTTETTEAKSSLTFFGLGPEGTKTNTSVTIDGFGTTRTETPYNTGAKAETGEVIPKVIDGLVKDTSISIALGIKIELGLK